MNGIANSVQLIGNIGVSLVPGCTPNGKKFIRFAIATNEIFKDASGTKREETQWHNLVAWGKLADIVVKFLCKGKRVAVEGKLIHRSYTDKEGVKRYITEVVVRELLFLDMKKVENETV